MGNIANVHIGIQKIRFGDMDLGHTSGGCEFKYEPQYTDIVVDLYGKTVVDKALVGEVVKVKVPLAEITLAHLKMAIPTGTMEEGAVGKKFIIGSIAGKRLSTSAKPLVLHPSWLPDTDKTLDITLHKAVIVSEIALPFRKDEQTVYEVEFMALLDETKTEGGYLATIGEDSVKGDSNGKK